MNAHASYHASNRTHSHQATAKTSASRLRTPSVLSAQTRTQSPTLISIDRIWDPNLLDRLHSPLSRYTD